MPSANPNGRPRKAKIPPNSSIKDAVTKGLAKEISTREDGVASRRTQSEAMIMVLIARFPTASVREQVSILRYFGEVAPTALQEASRDLPPNAVEELVKVLAREAQERGL
jgi:hypothetical protein